MASRAGKKKSPAKASNTGSGSGSGNMSAALRKQENMLAENPQIDYVIFSEPHQPADHGISFRDAMGKLFFRVMRDKAIQGDRNPKSIRLMYDQLLSMVGVAHCRAYIFFSMI
jgi:hypothetical protein